MSLGLYNYLAARVWEHRNNAKFGSDENISCPRHNGVALAVYTHDDSPSYDVLKRFVSKVKLNSWMAGSFEESTMLHFYGVEYKRSQDA